MVISISFQVPIQSHFHVCFFFLSLVVPVPFSLQCYVFVGRGIWSIVKCKLKNWKQKIEKDTQHKFENLHCFLQKYDAIFYEMLQDMRALISIGNSHVSDFFLQSFCWIHGTINVETKASSRWVLCRRCLKSSHIAYFSKTFSISAFLQMILALDKKPHSLSFKPLWHCSILR